MTTPLKNFILIVEDDLAIAEMLVLAFALHGYASEYATDGLEALKFIEEFKPPDLILCDIEMPNMDGLAFIEHKRKTPNVRDIPVILMSARKDGEALASVNGVVAFIQKPFELFRVMKLVEVVLAEKVNVRGS